MAANQSSSHKQTQQGHMARVSIMALGDKALPVRFMYKTVPEHLNDTGWRLFTGYEGDDFIHDYKHLPPFPLDKLPYLDTLAHLLDSNAGTVWERCPGQAWQQVHDFVIPVEEVPVKVDGYKVQPKAKPAN